MCATYVLCNFTQYIGMIKSIKHKGLRLLYYKNDASKLPQSHIAKISMILDIIDNLEKVPQDLMFYKTLRPHPYKNMDNIWSLDVTGNWRILFRFVDGDAFDVDYIDPH